MLNIGAGEIALILVVALLVLGPTKLPELARGIGKFLREFRRQTDEVRSTLEHEFYKMDQDLTREEIKPIARGDANGEAKILPPAITGPLDGGRRPANELPLPKREVHGLEGAHTPPAAVPPSELAEPESAPASPAVTAVSAEPPAAVEPSPPERVEPVSPPPEAKDGTR